MFSFARLQLKIGFATHLVSHASSIGAYKAYRIVRHILPEMSNTHQRKRGYALLSEVVRDLPGGTAGWGALDCSAVNHGGSAGRPHRLAWPKRGDGDNVSRLPGRQ